MGATHSTVPIRNLAKLDKTWEGLFLIDTEAIDEQWRRQHAEAYTHPRLQVS